MEVSEKAYKNAILNLNECHERLPVLKSYPLKLYIEPTIACNLHCIYCYPDEIHKTQKLDMNVFHSLKEQLFDYMCEVNLFLSGEPTLHKDFPEMLDICSRYPFITKFFTNLNYRNDDLLKKMVETGCWVNVSFDGLDGNELRIGSDVNLILENVKKLQEYQKRIRNKKFHIRIATVVGKHNVDYLCSMIDWMASKELPDLMLGCIDATEVTKQYKLTAEDAEAFEIAIYRADLHGIRISTPTHIGGVKLKKTNNWNEFSLPVDKYFCHFCEDCNPDVEERFCTYPWIQTVVDCFNNVVACCQQKIPIGTFTPDTDFIKEIWNNEAYQNLRKLHDYTTCTAPYGKGCDMITYSIWGGERRLNNIPSI